MTVKEEAQVKSEAAEPKLEKDVSDDVVEVGDQGSDAEDDGPARRQGKKGNKPRSMNFESYDYVGENSDIGVILALKSERFNKKVVF